MVRENHFLLYASQTYLSIRAKRFHSHIHLCFIAILPAGRLHQGPDKNPFMPQPQACTFLEYFLMESIPRLSPAYLFIKR